MDRSTLRHIPPDDLRAHTVRTALTVMLTRVQIARRRLSQGNYAEVDQQLAEVEDYIRRTADTPEIAPTFVTNDERH